MKNNIKILNKIKANRSTLLVSIGILGGTLAAIKAVKDTPKALELIEMKKEELQVDKLPVKTLISTCWKVYTPSVLMGVLSGSCIVYGQYYTNKELVGMTALYGATASNLQRYKDAVNTVATPEVTKAVKEKVAESAIKETKNSKQIKQIEPIGEGDFWCVDSLTGQRFKSTIDDIKNAEININDRRINQGYVSLTDLMYEFGVNNGILSDDVGWRVMDGKIKLDYTSAIVIDGKPHLYIEYYPQPRPNFDSAY